MQSLAVISTHPIQYQAPVWQEVEEGFGIPTRVIYGSDFSVVGFRDPEFGTTFAWDVNLLPNPDACTFLSRSGDGGAKNISEVRSAGIGNVLDRLGPSAVLLTGYGNRFHIDAFWATFRRGIPILFRAETSDHVIGNHRARGALRSAFLRLLYRRFHRLLPIGIRSHAHYRGLGCPENKLVFSPYCVDTRCFQWEESYRANLRAGIRAQLGVTDSDSVLLFSGKLSERKGIFVLTSALKLLPEELRKRMFMLFVGDGADRASIATACARSPVIRAHFAGFRNQLELSPFYHASDALVLPSISGETWGLVVNEALQHGLPCVVSDAVGCAPDLIEDGKTGYCCSAGDASDLAAAIASTLAMSRTERSRSICRTKISRYSVNAAAQGIASAFSQVLATA